jgi:ubiquinone/menaquinone biosynthesis C-methylase UbiE
VATSAESVDFWNRHQVAEFAEDVTEQESLRVLNWRNNLYPGLLDLMPVAGFEGKTVLDFGCGPGHDTIGFLLNGVKHVYALDSSQKGLKALRARLKAHGLSNCSVLPGSELPYVPLVDHIHCAGVLHHLADPSAALRMLARALRPEAEIRMMVYSSESEFFQVQCGGSAELFARTVDHGAPIVRAWSRVEVADLAAKAGLVTVYRGSYRIPDETTGPGLSACYSLMPWS